MALDWIQNYIEDYGGDSTRVTLFGQSAGSMAISVLLAVEQAKFQRAILQSGTLIRPFFQLLEKTNRTESNLEFANLVSCGDNINQTIMSCLRSKTVQELVAQTFTKPVHQLWEPVVDTDLQHPIFPLDLLSALSNGKFKNVDIIIGSNSGDGIAQLGGNVLKDPSAYENLQKNFRQAGPELFLGRADPDDEDIFLAERLRYYYLRESILDSSIDKNLVDLMTDNMYEAGGRIMLEILSILVRNNNLYQYLFDYYGTKSHTTDWFNISRPELGSCHSDDLYYLFKKAGEESLITAHDQRVSDVMTSFWANFAKSGNPNDKDNIWSAFTMDNRQYLKISEDVEMEMPAAYKDKVKFWREIFFQSPIEETSAGYIKGSYMTSVNGKCIKSYQGIPYAQPPIGRLRFVDPVSKSSWDGVLDATKLKAKCISSGASTSMSEDCLHLNIYTPCQVEEGMAVMVWIHGSLFEGESAGTDFYGPEYIVDENIILVTVEYRKGPFGFISLESNVMPGNQGLKDQRLALSWIQQHIQSFGGDKTKVTLFGGSEGSERNDYCCILA